jgi:hypothetical protein
VLKVTFAIHHTFPGISVVFSELKNLVGLRRLRLRRIKFVREQFYLAAVAQNLKRLVRFLGARPQLIQASNS